jgi:hypothetical protein
MTAPHDQLLRQRRFTRDHPQWPVRAQDGASRFTAEKDDGSTRHIVANPSLKSLPGRFNEIEGSR